MRYSASAAIDCKELSMCVPTVSGGSFSQASASGPSRSMTAPALAAARRQHRDAELHGAAARRAITSRALAGHGGQVGHGHQVQLAVEDAENLVALEVDRGHV